ncbi:Uma2 family endonuclease [Fimbriiglobus ruber]|uniref:Putative restriction endonuclease domain-containing protein n=1 Tax=Fimbriiglobus ruber TaxID=1908690 RepID=A0A225E987_9BACT|nr:Uma2 family endonuclease [Fimbriiglobus ruber]OWK47308.1 hypothetical protein FRUB_01007 [Fimbriiglobus ruber]
MIVKLHSVPETMADFHERLGFVPLDRIRMDPPPGTATEADVLRYLESGNKSLYELVDGVLVEKAVGTHETSISTLLVILIGSFVKEHKLGLTFAGDGPFRLAPGNVRYPDVSFIPWSLVPKDRTAEKIWPVTPVLAVEVLSESNTKAEIDRKIHELFATGCKLVWIIDPVTQTARAYTSASQSKNIPADGHLDGGKVLPGFRLPLAELFQSIEEPGQQG